MVLHVFVAAVLLVCLVVFCDCSSSSFVIKLFVASSQQLQPYLLNRQGLGKRCRVS